MANGKNCFIQTVKLPHVRGRVRYISDPKRQENLYAAYTSADPKFWQYLSKENQADFARSGTEGKCIEAREMIIMLPPGLIHYDHDTLLKYFTAKFVERYGVAVASSLHHNKRKTIFISILFFQREKLMMSRWRRSLQEICFMMKQENMSGRRKKSWMKMEKSVPAAGLSKKERFTKSISSSRRIRNSSQKIYRGYEIFLYGSDQ